MIRDHPVVHVFRPIGIHARGVCRGLNQVAHQVGFVVVVLALQQRANPFQPHASIDGLHFQWRHRAVSKLLVLHENDVPNLDKTVAIFVRRAGRTAPNMLTVVVENLGARAAGTGGPHLPKVIRRRDPNDPLFGDTDLFPDLKGFIVCVVNSRIKTVLVDPEVFGDQFPRETDGVLFEVIPKAKVAQHLEKRVVAGGVAHVVEVVVLAPGAHAFLRGRGAFVIAMLQPSEHVFELHHARIGKHKGRVIARHKGGAVHHLVPISFEIVKKSGANIVQAGHGGSYGCLASRRCSCAARGCP